MADTKLRSPDGTRERWFNEKEVAHLTTKADPADRWTFAVTSEKPPRDPHDVIDEAPVEQVQADAPAEETPLNALDPEERPVQKPKPKPLPKPKSANQGKGR